MGDHEDLLEWVETRLRPAEIAMHEGDAGPRFQIWARTDPVTLLGAGYSGSGYDAVSNVFHQLEREFSGCSSFSFDLLAADAGGDLAYTVGYEHISSVINGEPRDYTLRTTQIYRREGGEWKVVHRHADHEAAGG